MNSDFHLHYDHGDDGSEDEDIKRAILDSLQTTKEELIQKNKVDNDLDKAIQLSLQQPQSNTTTPSNKYNKNKNDNEKQITIIDDDEDFKVAISNSLQDISSSTLSAPSNINSRLAKVESDKIELAWYLNRLPGFSREANTPSLSLRDIVAQEGLESALITTYELNLEWLLSKLPILTKVPVTMVHGEKSPEALPRPPANITYHKPNLPLQWGVHHGKMFALYYPDHIRIAVSTANLIMVDYERKSQGIWMQDFPKKKQNDKDCDFESTLVDYVSRLGLNTTKIRQYDYTSANVVLITSVPGYHKGATMSKYGHMKLRTALQNEKIHSKFRDASIACQFSSTGSLSKDWVLEEMMSSFTVSGGYHGMSEKKEEKTEEKKSEKKTLSDKKRSRDTRDTLTNNMELIWPTAEFVRNSLDGWAAGGSLCFPAKNLKSFMQESKLFYSYTSFHGREHVPPHIKTYSRYLPDGELAWNYLTSSNFSKAAMGELQKSATQLMIRHYEIGVLFVPSLYSRGQGPYPKFITLQGHLASPNQLMQPTYSTTHSSTNSTTNPTIQSNTNSTPSTSQSSQVVGPLVGFPLPYTLPPKIYSGADEPWVWDVPRSKQDLYGRKWLC